MYIIKISQKINLNYFIWTKSQYDMNFQSFFKIMFKMKFLKNRMQCNILIQQVGWFDGRGVHFHFKGQRIKSQEWCVCGQ